MKIEIKDLHIEAIIGILPKERQKAQTIIVDLWAKYDYIDGIYIDYANLALMIQKTLIEKKFGLIEEALLALKDEIFHTYTAINTLKLRLQKPDILENCYVGISQKWNRKKEK